ncbi:aminoglycoside phosphotransferase family protein [Streptomyces sp. NPDC058459]|uniref:aminoglycoside phosphotransferase family protein n=1 Tax=Streptomyces sp. NPDC058459 TaxID=3346508 RepID=UPI003669E246
MRPVSTQKMRAGEIGINAGLVGRLVARRFPAWAGLPVTRLTSSGTENAMFRLGPELVVRLPRHPGAVADVTHERDWLPRLAPGLPVAVPEPVGSGEPDDGFPWPWSVYRWLEGANPVAGAVKQPERLAKELGTFVATLRRSAAVDAPPGYRGGPLSGREGSVREALAQLGDRLDTAEAAARWERALAAPAYTGPPVWSHGDLSPGNVLVGGGGSLSAVIDFGCAGVGDPAVDLIVAWNLLPASARTAFREAVGADDAEWARGRGWALSVALVQLPYYWRTNPVLAQNARHTIGEVLAESA